MIRRHSHTLPAFSTELVYCGYRFFYLCHKLSQDLTTDNGTHCSVSDVEFGVGAVDVGEVIPAEDVVVSAFAVVVEITGGATVAVPRGVLIVFQIVIESTNKLTTAIHKNYSRRTEKIQQVVLILTKHGGTEYRRKEKSNAINLKNLHHFRRNASEFFEV